MITKAQVIDRLSQFGYEIKVEDEAAIEFEIIKTQNYVYNYCNITSIPPMLEHRVIDRICSFVLFNLKNTGRLEGFDYEPVIKQIKEGDTSIQYANGQGEDTPENRFDAFIKQLERGFDKWLTPYRALRW
jgi:hypothetical protein